MYYFLLLYWFKAYRLCLLKKKKEKVMKEKRYGLTPRCNIETNSMTKNGYKQATESKITIRSSFSTVNQSDHYTEDQGENGRFDA